MKHYLGAVFAFTAIVFLACASAQAETGEKMVIALATDEFELAETDISTLVIGEAQTIETDSGKIIDILRTADGAEIYIDGELLELTDDENDSLHWLAADGENIVIHKEIELICHDDEKGSGCTENEVDIETFRADHENGDGHKIIVIKKAHGTKD